MLTCSCLDPSMGACTESPLMSFDDGSGWTTLRGESFGEMTAAEVISEWRFSVESVTRWSQGGPSMRSRTRHWGGGVRSVGAKKISDPQNFWPFSATDTTASWNNGWKPKKNYGSTKFWQILYHFSPNLAYSVQNWLNMEISYRKCCKLDSV